MRILRHLPFLALGLSLAIESHVVWRQGVELTNWRRRAAEHSLFAEKLAAAGRTEQSLRARADSQAQSTAAAAFTAGEARRPGAVSFNAAFQAGLKDPEFRRLLASLQKCNLDHFYAALFKRLNLPPARLDRLKDLMVEEQLAKSDALALASGPDAAPGGDALAATALSQKDIADEIRSLLGAAGYEQLQEYQETRFMRLAAAQLQQSLSYTATPLSDDQANQLVQAWEQALPPGRSGDPTGYVAQVGAGLADDTSLYLRRSFPAQGYAAAQGFLSQPQLAALAQLEQAQEAGRDLARLRAAAAP